MRRDSTPIHLSLSISPIRNSSGQIVGASKIARDITDRKRAEQALRSTTAKLEAVFNQSGIFAGIMDLQGNLKEVNDSSINACGYTREQVLDRPFWDTPWWRGSEEIKERIALRRGRQAGSVFRDELRYWVADGTEHWVDFAMHPIRDQNGAVIFLHPTGIDITARTVLVTRSTRRIAGRSCAACSRSDASPQGVGASLVRGGLDRLAASGETIIFVLGNPDYYALRLRARSGAAIHLCLRRAVFHGAAPGRHRAARRGIVRYPAVFEGLS